MSDKSEYRQALERVREVSQTKDRCSAQPYTLVQVQATVDGVNYVAAGLATCSEDDTWNAELGLTIARGRAEAKIAKDVVWQQRYGGRSLLSAGLVALMAEAAEGLRQAFARIGR